MPRLINGRRPSRRTTLWLSVGLFSLGCVLALCERFVTVFDPYLQGFSFDVTRLAPLIILILLVPLCLSLRHFRHPRPYWLYPLALTVLAGWLGYFLLFHILPQEKLPPDPLPIPWWDPVLSLIVIWLISVGIATATVALLHLIWKPTFKNVCDRCGYPLQGLTSDKCPECGESIAHLHNQVTED